MQVSFFFDLTTKHQQQHFKHIPFIKKKKKKHLLYCDSYYKVSVKSMSDICATQDNHKMRWIKYVLARQRRTVLYWNTSKQKDNTEDNVHNYVHNLIRVKPLLKMHLSKSIQDKISSVRWRIKQEKLFNLQWFLRNLSKGVLCLCRTTEESMKMNTKIVHHL